MPIAVVSPTRSSLSFASVKSASVSSASFRIVFRLVAFRSKNVEVWDYEIDFGDYQSQGKMILDHANGALDVSLVSLDDGTFDFENVDRTDDKLSGDFTLYGKPAHLNGSFVQDDFSGNIKLEEEEFLFTAKKQSAKVFNNRSLQNQLHTIKG